jgi:glycosyltransferase involved in cell wall biosynthesis
VTTTALVPPVLSSVRRKVALVTPYYWPIIGGITTFVDGLRRCLEALGLDVRIWTRYGDTSEAVETGPKNPYLFARWARRRIALWGPDVIHAQSHWYTLASAFGWRGPIAPRTVFTVHTDFRPPEGRFKENLLSRILGKADVITAVSESSIAKLRSRFPKLRCVELLTPGVRELSASPGQLEQVIASYALAGKFPRLVTIGMMVWQDKAAGMEVLVSSLPAVLRQFPDARLLVLGDGPSRSMIEDAVSFNRLTDSVLFVGAQENPAPFILASDIFIYCSFQDTFSQAIIESLSLGRPVIANLEVVSNLGGDPLAKGIVGVPATPDGMAEAIRSLASNSDLRLELGRRGVVAASGQFSWARNGPVLLRIYGLSMRESG